MTGPLKKKKKKKKKKEEGDSMGQILSNIVRFIFGETNLLSSSHSSDSCRDNRTSGMDLREIWIKHYCSLHKILLVGDGDFSFSASLAMAFGSAPNMIATSLNSRECVVENYRNAMSNIQCLMSRGAKVMHDVNATTMANHLWLKGLTFDRIVFNFPLAGFFPNEPRKSQLRQHQELIRVFLANAKKMITEKGEIHITHKSNGFFLEWDLEELASNEGLLLIEDVPFNFRDYPGYRTKYGFGGDKNFNCNPSKTYKFGLRMITPKLQQPGRLSLLLKKFKPWLLRGIRLSLGGIILLMAA